MTLKGIDNHHGRLFWRKLAFISFTGLKVELKNEFGYLGNCNGVHVLKKVMLQIQGWKMYPKKT